MFTIDLLKGRGKPTIKYQGTLLLYITAMVVPVIILLVFTGQYFIAKAAIPSVQSQIKSVDRQIASSKSHIDYHNKINNQITLFNDCMGELAFALNQQTIWTPIITAIVGNMPDEVIMEEMSAKSRNFTERVPSKEDPDKIISINRIKRVVGMTFSAPLNSGSDLSMQKYIWKLRDIGLDASMKNQEIAEENNSKVKKYQIEFTLEQS